MSFSSSSSPPPSPQKIYINRKKKLDVDPPGVHCVNYRPSCLIYPPSKNSKQLIDVCGMRWHGPWLARVLVRRCRVCGRLQLQRRPVRRKMVDASPSANRGNTTFKKPKPRSHRKRHTLPVFGCWLNRLRECLCHLAAGTFNFNWIKCNLVIKVPYESPDRRKPFALFRVSCVCVCVCVCVRCCVCV